MRSNTTEGPSVRIHPVSRRNGLAWFNRLRGRAFRRGYIALGLTVAGDYYVAKFFRSR